MNILDVPMDENDANAQTVRDYLKSLLLTVWLEGEEFSGKRPFGNSGWDWEIYLALATAKVISATWDEYGDLDDCDRGTANDLIVEAIKGLQ